MEIKGWGRLIASIRLSDSALHLCYLHLHKAQQVPAGGSLLFYLKLFSLCRKNNNKLVDGGPGDANVDRCSTLPPPLTPGIFKDLCRRTDRRTDSPAERMSRGNQRLNCCGVNTSDPPAPGRASSLRWPSRVYGSRGGAAGAWPTCLRARQDP